MNERKPPAFEYVLLHGTRDLRPRYRDAVRESGLECNPFTLALQSALHFLIAHKAQTRSIDFLGARASSPRARWWKVNALDDFTPFDVRHLGVAVCHGEDVSPA